MSWVSDLSGRRRCQWGRRRAPASDNGDRARLRSLETGVANAQSQGVAVPTNEGTRRMLVPALAPHPTRREASSGVIRVLERLVEPASGFVPTSP